MIANAVKTATVQKGKALFHPIRIVLTGRAEGPELDLAIPAIDRGAELTVSAGLPPIVGWTEPPSVQAAVAKKHPPRLRRPRFRRYTTHGVQQERNAVWPRSRPTR